MVTMGVVSVNMKKIKATTGVNRLLDENYRTDATAKKYDDGHRNIDTQATQDNVFLIDKPDDYDKVRKEKINRVNELRSKRIDPLLVLKNSKRALKEKGKLKAANNKHIASTRKLRSDTVDTIGIVVQPDADFINALSRNEQVNFFSDALDVIKDDYEYFGAVETAVIHFDETTPHMQILTSTINEETLSSDAKMIMGNKTKMSNRQDVIADGLKVKGWDVERGMKRIDNPDYQNFKSEAESLGYEVTRHNDKQLQLDLKAVKEILGNAQREADIIIQRANKTAERYVQAEMERLRSERVKVKAEIQDAYQKLSEARLKTNEAYANKKAYDDEYNAQWGKYSTRMARMREEQDAIWKDPKRRAEWDNVANGLRNAKDMQKLQKNATWLDVAFAFIGVIQEHKYEKQIESLKQEREKALEENRREKQASKEEWQDAKEKMKTLKIEIKKAADERNSLQSKVNSLKGINERLELAKQGLAPFQQEADKNLLEAKRIKSYTANTWERILGYVREGALKPNEVEKVAEKYKDFTADDLDDLSNDILELTKGKNRDKGLSL